jgi:uncharacterized membrane protein
LKSWMDIAITRLLRTGVLLSVGIIAAGMVIAFVHDSASFSTSPGTHFPNTISEVIAGVRIGNGPAIMMLGLLVLIATPVARVALSIVIFIIERDRIYAAITAAVFVILMIAFAVGRAAS